MHFTDKIAWEKKQNMPFENLHLIHKSDYKTLKKSLYFP